MVIDQKAFSYHTATFMLSSAMTLPGPLADPGPADMQYEYIIWDILCRRALLWALAEHIGATIVPSPQDAPAEPHSDIGASVLAATGGRIDTAHSKPVETGRLRHGNQQEA